VKKKQNLQPIEDIKISKKNSVDEIVKQMFKSGGFTAKNLSIGINIIESMLKEKNV
jgi:deoxyhypusine synthase